MSVSPIAIARYRAAMTFASTIVTDLSEFRTSTPSNDRCFEHRIPRRSIDDEQRAKLCCAACGLAVLVRPTLQRSNVLSLHPGAGSSSGLARPRSHVQLENP